MHISNTRKSNTPQAGFGAVPIIAAILVVVTLVGAGYAVWHKRIEKNAANAAMTPTTDSPKTTNQNPTPAKLTTSGATLTIKEWGVKLTLPETMKDTYYVPDLSNENMMFIGLTSLDSEKCKATGNTANQTPVSTILRLKPNDRDPVSGELYVDQYKNGIQVGDFYYAYAGWHRTGRNYDACGTDAQRTEIDNVFNAAIKTIEKGD